MTAIARTFSQNLLFCPLIQWRFFNSSSSHVEEWLYCRHFVSHSASLSLPTAAFTLPQTTPVLFFPHKSCRYLTSLFSFTPRQLIPDAMLALTRFASKLV